MSGSRRLATAIFTRWSCPT